MRHKHPVVEKILEHRGLKKLLGSTYIDALPQLNQPAYGPGTYVLQPNGNRYRTPQLQQPEFTEHPHPG
nr:hypothetical protein [Bacteroides nordii]